MSNSMHINSIVKSKNHNITHYMCRTKLSCSQLLVTKTLASNCSKNCTIKYEQDGRVWLSKFRYMCMQVRDLQHFSFIKYSVLVPFICLQF